MANKKKIAFILLLVLLPVFVAAIGTSRLIQYYEDTVHGSGDKGFLTLFVRNDGPAALSADGKYSPGQVGKHGELYVASDQVHIDIDPLEATTPTWTASADAAAAATSTTHSAVYDSALSLNCTKSAGTVTEASYGKTITSIDGAALSGAGLVEVYVKHVNFTNVGAIFVRLGTSASHYNEYSIDPNEFSTSLWNHVSFSLHSGAQTGTGLDLSAITYVAFGVTMDAAGNTVTAVLFDEIGLHSINAAELSITGNVANTVRVSKVGSPSNATVTTGAGNISTGTQRVTFATDDVNLDAINAVTQGRAIAASGQHLDNAGAGTAATTNYTVTVVALATYRVHAVNGVIYLGILDATTDANAIWSVGASEKIEITIPSGTALHYFVDTAGVEGRLARIQ